MRLYGGIFSQKDSDQLSLIADTDSVKSSDESPNPAAAAAASQSSGRLNLWSLLRSEFTDVGPVSTVTPSPARTTSKCFLHYKSKFRAKILAIHYKMDRTANFCGKTEK